MILTLIWVLIIILVAGAVLWAIRQAVVPHPWGVIAQVVVGLIFFLLILDVLLPAPFFLHRGVLP